MEEKIIYVILSALFSGLIPVFFHKDKEKNTVVIKALIFSLIALSFSVLTAVLNSDFIVLLSLSLNDWIDSVCVGSVSAITLITVMKAISSGSVKQVVPVLFCEKFVYDISINRFDIHAFNTLYWTFLAVYLIGVSLVVTEPANNRGRDWLLYAVIAMILIAFRKYLRYLFFGHSEISGSLFRIPETAVMCLVLMLVLLLGNSIKKCRIPGLSAGVSSVISGVLYGLSILCMSATVMDGSITDAISIAVFPISMAGARVAGDNSFSVKSMVGVLLVIIADFGMLLYA